MQETQESSDVKQRELQFNQGLKELMEKTQLGLHAFAVITPDGRVGAMLKLTDESEEAKKQRQEAAEAVAAANGVQAA